MLLEQCFFVLSVLIQGVIELAGIRKNIYISKELDDALRIASKKNGKTMSRIIEGYCLQGIVNDETKKTDLEESKILDRLDSLEYLISSHFMNRALEDTDNLKSLKNKMEVSENNLTKKFEILNNNTHQNNNLIKDGTIRIRKDIEENFKWTTNKINILAKNFSKNGLFWGIFKIINYKLALAQSVTMVSFKEHETYNKAQSKAKEIYFTDLEKLGRKEQSQDNEPVQNQVCPECGKNMTKHKGKNGFFWGCTGYPKCKASILI